MEQIRINWNTHTPKRFELTNLKKQLVGLYRLGQPFSLRICGRQIPKWQDRALGKKFAAPGGYNS